MEQIVRTELAGPIIKTFMEKSVLKKHSFVLKMT